MRWTSDGEPFNYSDDFLRAAMECAAASGKKVSEEWIQVMLERFVTHSRDVVAKGLKVYNKRRDQRRLSSIRMLRRMGYVVRDER